MMMMMMLLLLSELKSLTPNDDDDVVHFMNEPKYHRSTCKRAISKSFGRFEKEARFDAQGSNYFTIKLTKYFSGEFDAPHFPTRISTPH